MAALACAACGGGSNGGTGTDRFELTSINVRDGESWRLNRPIDVRFDREIDFETVSANTVQIQSVTGEPATGRFSLLPGGDGLRFEASCPTRADSSDAGLQPGLEYVLAIVGTTSGGVTVRAADGQALELGRSVRFRTPDSTRPRDLFVDRVPGPPEVRVRGAHGIALDEEAASRVELGGDESRTVYWLRVPGETSGTLEATPHLPEGDGDVLLPLNLYSRAEERPTFLLELDQAVSPAESNFEAGRVRLEARASAIDSWRALPARVELIANCTETGARVRLSPLGLLPQDAEVRVVLGRGFADLTGDGLAIDRTDLLAVRTMPLDMRIASDGAQSAKRGADEWLERFVYSAGEPDSLEDPRGDPSFPRADWGAGELRAGFAFDGQGGPGGDFDWHVAEETTVVLDTNLSTIQGGPGGIPVRTQNVVGGRVDVRDLYLPATSQIIVQGPNPCRILATGRVEVRGTISVRGSNSPGVGTLDTTNLPEPGASGQGGGGAGGTASFLSTQSTPRGGSGRGAFGLLGLGGEGGESSYSTSGKNARRGGGGGGGRFGPDVRYRWNQSYSESTGQNPLPPGAAITWPPANVHPEIDRILCQELVGFDAEAGRMGGDGGLGAESQSMRAQGGRVGPSPFEDEDDENDFYGSMRIESGGLERVVQGELDGLWAGAGGGAGGDAVSSSTFPLTPFEITGDEKGAGGGGGGGGIEISAIGEIVIGTSGDAEPTGGILADGGDGGGGENKVGFDRVGGGSGGGSGGHIVLSSATSITIHGHSRGLDADSSIRARWYNEPFSGRGRRVVSALGGQGGSGRQNRGGANEDGPTPPRCDSIPHEAFPTIVDVAADLWPFPLGDISGFASYTCFDNQFGVDFGTEPGDDRLDWGDADPDRQASPGAGGDGSPGLVQLHVPDPATDLVLPDCERLDESGVLPIGDGRDYGRGRDVTQAIAPPPVGWHDLERADTMLPFFGAESAARSKWIRLGEPIAGLASGRVRYRFDGTDPNDGSVLRDALGEAPLEVEPILGACTLGDGARLDGDSLVALDASRLADGDRLYARNPALLRFFALTIEAGGERRALDVAAVEYDLQADELLVTVAAGERIELAGSEPSEWEFSLVPRSFSVETDGEAGAYPEHVEARIRFSGTWIGSDGAPDETIASPFSADVEALNDPVHPGTGQVRPFDLVRFDVWFTIDAQGSGEISNRTPRPGLGFLRLPFEFGELD